MPVHPLPSAIQPIDVCERLRGMPGLLFLDSSRRHETLGRYSYVMADPYDWVTCQAYEDGFSRLANQLSRCACDTLTGLPPFQGGAAGLFGYDLCHSLEQLPSPKHQEFPTPAMAVGLYDVVFAWDHLNGAAFIISQGQPELGVRKRVRAEQRLQKFLALLEEPVKVNVTTDHERKTNLAPQFGLANYPGVTSDFSRDAYIGAVAKAVEYIHAGDIFQVNLSQRLLAPLYGNAWSYYLQLRGESPAPFSAYFDVGDFQLCSASPERFLHVEDRQVETRPIKGTRPRADDPRVDAGLAIRLTASEKDRSENTMIVDLLRNDLSRVCTDASVTVPTLCGLESYEQVHHLVSVVRGKLRPEATALDLLRASFPGGSITGAPKVRAMEIIAELEPTARGPYCGSLGYIGFDGAMDTNILIRTAIASRGYLQMPVGGGIVADSDPEVEYAETLQKATGMLAALPNSNGVGRRRRTPSFVDSS